MTRPGRAVVVGVGNPWRGDDGAGPAVAAAVRARCTARVGGPAVAVVELDGEPARILDAWDGAALAVVVDAVRTGAPPGTIHRLEEGRGPVAAASSHGLGVADAVALGRALDRLPHRLVLVGVEGARFGQAAGLSPPVAAAVAPAARLVAAIVEQRGRGHPPAPRGPGIRAPR